MFSKPYIDTSWDLKTNPVLGEIKIVRDFNMATKSCRHHWSFLYYDRLIGEITNMETIPAAFIGD
jgi:hypothetical protein